MRKTWYSFCLSIVLIVACLASEAAWAAPAGDCDCSGQVTIDELVRIVGIAIGDEAVQTCPVADTNHDGRVGVDEVVLSVSGALSGTERAIVALRGVIEGFYGPPYTFGQRLDLLRFLATAGMNAYVYAPKNDPLHRELWRDPYPPEFLDHFAELAATGEKIGVRFAFALSPGKGLDPEAGDAARVQEKLGSLMDVGVRHFCLFFDDVAADEPGADPDVQVSLVNDTFAFLRGRDPEATLCFISNFYAGTAEQMATDSSPFAALYPTPSSVYFEAYRRLAPEIPILWTGAFVFSDPITLEQARHFREFVGRPLILWDNYPVNDVALTRELFLGPYTGREAGLETALEGVFMNTMLQPQASKIALWTAARFFEQGACYDGAASLDEALGAVAGTSGADALGALAEHFQGHPLIGDGAEAERLATAIGAFFADESPAARAELVSLLERYAANEAELDATLANRALFEEVREPARKLARLGQAALAALDLLERAGSGEEVDAGPLEEMIATANIIPWNVGANTPLPPSLALLLGGHDATPADVFGAFFQRVRDEIAGASAEK